MIDFRRIRTLKHRPYMKWQNVSWRQADWWWASPTHYLLFMGDVNGQPSLKLFITREERIVMRAISSRAIPLNQIHALRQFLKQEMKWSDTDWLATRRWWERRWDTVGVKLRMR